VLILTSVLARLPMAMFPIGLLVHVQRVTGSFGFAGLVGGAYVAARSFAVPLLGRVVDRHGQTKTLVLTATVSTGLVSLVSFFPGDWPRVFLILLSVGVGVSRPPISSAVRALLPAVVVESELLPTAYALESVALELTFIFGPPLALFLAALSSSGAALACTGFVMLIGTVTFAVQPASRAWQPVRTSSRPRGGALHSPVIRALALVLVALGLVFGAVEVGVTAAAKALGSTADAAPVLGLWGFGSLFGGVIAARFGDASRRVGVLVLLLAGLAAGHGALAATTGSIPAMAIVILLAGAMIAPTYTSIYAMVDRAAPVGTATEAFAWLEAAVCIGTAGGTAAAGAIAQHVGSASVFALAGVAGVAGVFVAAFGLRTQPGARRLISRSYRSLASRTSPA
jgi:MFS family permease